ncbi:T9SS type A sorting domain-containing protein [Runella sp.]|uniref:T9SS type A sorting domain-containing protein n=1 Tax=Runella sp. TaxID=1960881 RepID=UPI003D09914F
MKTFYLFLLLLLVWFKSYCAGEIAFTAFQSDTPDSFSWVALVPIPAGATILFTDNGWNGTSFRTNEGVLTWTAPAGGVASGTVVTMSGGTTVTAGTVTSTGTYALSTSGDQLFAFKGSLASPTFISAINFGSTDWTDTGASTNSTALPAGLANGSNAVAVGNQDNGRFNCSAGVVSGNMSSIGVSINTSSNWTTSASVLTPAVSTCSYTSSTLPVHLISFKSETQATTIELTWQTSEEINNSHFEIEKSSNAQTFEVIGRVIGKGTGNVKQVYSYTDIFPTSGLNYYRLKQVDFDGKFEYSRIVSAKFNGEGIFKAYPNPVISTLTIELPVDHEPESACLLDLTGHKIKEFSSKNLKLDDIENGVYMLQVKTKKGATFQQRILKIN